MCSKYTNRKILLVTILGFALFVSIVPSVVHADGEGFYDCGWVYVGGGSMLGCAPVNIRCTGDGFIAGDACAGLTSTACTIKDRACVASGTDGGIGGEDGGGGIGGEDEGVTTGSITIDNPLNVDSVGGLISKIVNFLTLVAGSILVVIILFGAFQIMTSSGNPENLKKGRNTIIWALIGFAVILLASGLGAIIANILGGTVETLPGTAGTATTTDVIGVINTIAGWMFGILMALGTVFVLYSAFLFLISGGDAQKVGTARRALIYAIVALVIGVLAGSAKLLVTNALDVSTSTSAPNCPSQSDIQAQYVCYQTCARDYSEYCCRSLSLCPGEPL